MHSTSLHVGYPRSPFKFPAFINALFIFMPHLGFEVVPGRQGPLASELQRRTAFEVSFATAPTPDRFPALAPECIRAPTPDYVSELQRRTVSEVS